jgi:hypothetical protein
VTGLSGAPVGGTASCLAVGLAHGEHRSGAQPRELPDKDLGRPATLGLEEQRNTQSDSGRGGQQGAGAVAVARDHHDRRAVEQRAAHGRRRGHRIGVGEHCQTLVRGGGGHPPAWRLPAGWTRLVGERGAPADAQEENQRDRQEAHAHGHLPFSARPCARGHDEDDAAVQRP